MDLNAFKNNITFVIQDFLKDAARCEDLITTIYEGIPEGIRTQLSGGSLSRSDIGKAKLSREGTCGLYAIFYDMGPDRNDAVYVGKSIQLPNRDTTHIRNAKAQGPKGSHYQTASEARARRSILLVEMPEGEHTKLAVAEQLFVLAIGSHRDWIVGKAPIPPANEYNFIERARDVDIARTISKVADAAFARTGWRTISSQLNLEGTNIKTPVAEYEGREGVIWTRIEQSELIEFRRSPVHVIDDAGKFRIHIQVIPNLSFRIPKFLPFIRKGMPIHVAVEISKTGPHRAPAFRLPLMGGYSDWEQLLTIAVRIAYETPEGICVKAYAQRDPKMDFWAAPGGFSWNYLMASKMNALFRGIKWSNPSEDRGNFPPLLAIEFQNDHLTRKVRITDFAIRETKPEPHLTQRQTLLNELYRRGFKPTYTALTAPSKKPSCDVCQAVPHTDMRPCDGDPSRPGDCRRTRMIGSCCTWNGLADLERRGMKEHVIPFPLFQSYYTSTPDKYRRLSPGNTLVQFNPTDIEQTPPDEGTTASNVAEVPDEEALTDETKAERAAMLEGPDEIEEGPGEEIRE